MCNMCEFMYRVAISEQFFDMYSNYSPPFPFGRICFVVLVMRNGAESS